MAQALDLPHAATLCGECAVVCPVKIPLPELLRGLRERYEIHHGVKFKDSELIGFPVRVGIGEKSLAKGEVEIKLRGGALLAVKAEEAVARVMELLKQ
mgnify:CR=1 FL=1